MQEVAKKTAQMQEELGKASVTGEAASGAVQCTMNGQQKPLSVVFGDGYLEAAAPETVSSDVMAAIDQAHEKSLKIMQEQMSALYAELGVPGAPGM